MYCNDAKNACHAAIDGEITAEERAALALHCRGCLDCAAYVRDMEALVGSLATLRDATQAIGSTTTAPPRSKRFPVLRWAGRVAAAVVLLLGSGILMRQFENSPIVVSPTPASPTIRPHVERAAVQIALANESIDRYIPVAQPSRAANVHVFVLYDQPAQRAAVHPQAPPSNPREE